jgi:hypothetical protein
MHLGLHCHEDGGFVFEWREPLAPERTGVTVVAPFEAHTHYFGAGEQQFMLNLRVDDLDALLAQLREEGVAVDARIEVNDFGRFAWIIDPEGRRVELWEPKAEASETQTQVVEAQVAEVKPKRTRNTSPRASSKTTRKTASTKPRSRTKK